jgi:hypothetical protein
MKNCGKCDESKPETEFYKDKRSADGLTRWCKVCRNAAVYKYRDKNREKVNQKRRDYAKQNPDKIRKWQKSWYENNPEAKDLHRSLQKDWRERTNYNAKRRKSGVDRAYINRLRCAHVTPPWANHEKIDEVYKQAAEISETTGVKHEVDHVVPLKHDLVTGLHVHYNLRVVEQSINRRKHASFKV